MGEASEKIMISYISTFAEPIFMIILMLILPPLLKLLKNPLYSGHYIF